MTPIVATLAGERVLIIAFSGRYAIVVKEGGLIQAVDLAIAALVVERPSVDFPVNDVQFFA